VIANQLIIFFGGEKHYILDKFHFGFRKNKSTKDVIATIIKNIIENLNNKIKCDCVLLGLKKAIDCIEHNTLMDKLHVNGVHGVSHKLIKFYLTSRTQVKVSYIAIN
jgi:hypothetical protein